MPFQHDGDLETREETSKNYVVALRAEATHTLHRLRTLHNRFVNSGRSAKVLETVSIRFKIFEVSIPVLVVHDIFLDF